MEQNTLYRKYRPILFDQVIGQDPIIKTLKNQIKNNNIAHAYMFCGTRGTGKTTVAKIFARAINCKNQKDGNPCNTCETCIQILDNNNLNVMEIDAAANNSINDIRKIKDIVKYPPLNNDKYKIFIIDEAHELSDAAADAFLKTLEEPPTYAIFILATTEPNKLKPTILSRCQRYDFRRIKIVDIVKNLQYICDKENINIDEESLNFIAEKSDGSMRESISILDRINGFLGDDKATIDIVKYILGVPDDKVFFDIINALLEEDIKNTLTIFDETVKNGKDITIFVNDFIYYLRNILIIKYLDKENEILSITKQKFNELKNLSEKISKEKLIFYIDTLSKLSQIIKTDENKQILVETTLIRLNIRQTNISTDDILNRLEELENNQMIVISNDDRKEKTNNKKILEEETKQQSNQILQNDKKEQQINKTNDIIDLDQQNNTNKNPFLDDEIDNTNLEKENNDLKNNINNDIKNDNENNIDNKINETWNEIIKKFDYITNTILKKSNIEIKQNENNIIINILLDSEVGYIHLTNNEISEKIQNEFNNIAEKNIVVSLKKI